MTETKEANNGTGLEIAVIGMAVRFPGARNINEFWDNLTNGVESITFFSDEELEAEGTAPETLKDSAIVTAKGVIQDIEYFDSSFFGYTPREAEVMDPQIRIFHECAWEALEHSGYDPATYPGLIGLYAGASPNLLWAGKNMFQSGSGSEQFSAGNLNSNFFSTLISYKLNLKGSSVTVQTACSTSLVAVHIACRSLLTGEVDMALAGGITVSIPQKTGYIYEEGMILSVDGHCRAFDAEATGTIGGGGAGAVVLKPLAHALESGDYIHAVIKGTAVNNDGDRKVGYTAPSVEGQAEVIATALEMAELEPESITYVEAHGTGTYLGDPIEIEALKLAFNTDKKGFCRIGSVKTNVGHLDCAAGVAGFIKTVLALQHRLIPPNLHFKSPNPKIDFENSPFYVNTKLSSWKNNNGFPLRAGISSFGIGGTNAHVILEEWPEQAGRKTQVAGRPHLILLSAKTSSALERMTENLANYLKEDLKKNPGNPDNPINPGLNLADAAYTLQVGRGQFKHRRMLLCSSIEEAVDALESPEEASSGEPGKARIHTSLAEEGKKHIVFMFPGQGSQYVNMGLELYRTEPVFRETMDRCFKILESIIGYDLKEALYPNSHASIDLNQTEITQPVIFAIEYALARLLMKWGLEPDAMIGHSIGEYVAACLSGVFSLEDALKLVALRGKLMQSIPPGSMLSIPLSEESLKPFLGEYKDIALAAVNTPGRCVVSGPHKIIDDFAALLEEKGHKTRKLHTSHAFHSPMMDPVLAEFEKHAAQVTLNSPRIPYISNVTGTWIAVEQAVDPGYWAAHLRRTVQFSAGLDKLLKKKQAVFVEIGPGKVLSTFVRQHTDKLPEHLVFNLVKHPDEKISDTYFLLEKVGRLWLSGIKIDWSEFYGGEKRYRIPLPTYPFEKQRFSIENDLSKIISDLRPGGRIPGKRGDIDDWFYIPSWKRVDADIEVDVNPTADEHRNWVVFIDDCGVGLELVNRLKKTGQQVTVVKPGKQFDKQEGDSLIFTIDPRQPDHYNNLFGELSAANRMPQRIVHLWGVTGKDSHKPLTGKERTAHVEDILDRGFYSLLNTARAVGTVGTVGTMMKEGSHEPLRVDVVTDGLQEVTGGEELEAEKAAVLGAVRVIPKEYPGIRCRSIDIERLPAENRGREALVTRLTAEVHTKSADTAAALRGRHRWVQYFEPVRLAEAGTKNRFPRLKKEGVYLITGGFGGMGLTLAAYLSETFQARLILIDLSPLPPREKWQESSDLRIQKVQELEAHGAEVLTFGADAANDEQMKGVFREALNRFARIDGIFHTAGVGDYAGVIHRRTREQSDAVLAPKLRGTLVLDEVLAEVKPGPDFLVLCSSLSSFLAPFGQVAYTAANAFLDAYALQKSLESKTFTVSINWDSWWNTGMTVQAVERLAGTIMNGTGSSLSEQDILKNALRPAEGIEVFKRILSAAYPQVLVSTLDFPALYEQAENFRISDLEEAFGSQSDALSSHPRPELSCAYTAPANETEQALARIWQGFFGIQQIGIFDDFFELGGDSLKALSLLTRVHKQFDVEIPITDFFNSSFIRGMGDIIAGSGKRLYTPIEPSEEKEYYLLSSAQKRLYFIQQLDPESTTYNLPEIVRLEGQVEKGKIEATYKKLIERYENFRTSFEMMGEEPVQRIHDDVEFGIEHYEVEESVTSRPLPNHFSSEGIIRDFIRPFYLSRAPLIRVGLIKEKSRGYILVEDTHHIMIDGTSYGIFLREFMDLYSGKELSPLRLQYKDYSEWHNHGKGSDYLISRQAFWLDQFRGDIPVLHLPFDYPRPAFQSFAGNTLFFEVGSKETAGLRRIAQQEGATLYMVLLAVYVIFSAKLSGQDDIIVGSPAAGRGHADLQQMIGMFVNTLALWNIIEWENTFLVYLQKIKQDVLKAFENQDYQFEDLVEELGDRINRDTSRNPLFDVMFSLQNMEFPEIKIPGLTLKPYEFKRGTAKFDLMLLSYESEDRLGFTFEYCTKLFKEETIERFADFYRKIVTQVVETPRKRISHIEIISEEEKQRLLVEFNDTFKEYIDRTIHELLETQAAAVPDRTAAVGRSRLDCTTSISYRMLNEKSNRLAHLLRVKGVAPDTVVGLMTEPSIEMIVGILAILKAGGAYLPLDPGHPDARIKYMLADSGAYILLTGQKYKSRYDNEVEIIDLESDEYFMDDTGNPAAGSKPDNLAYIIYTSGTTGKPRGTLTTHHNVLRVVKNTNYIELKQDDRVLQLSNYAFDGSVFDIYGALLNGASLVVMERERGVAVDRLAAVIEREAITVFFVTTALFNTLVELKPGCLAHIRKVLFGGERVSVEHCKKALAGLGAGKIIHVYGPTETTVYAAYYFIDHIDESAGTIPIGRPISNTAVYILDRGLKPVPTGIHGEIYIGGDGVARGYLNRPELMAEKFRRIVISHLSFVISSSESVTNDQCPMTNDRLYRTGDLARWLPDGNIEFLGRIDDQVKIRGFRIEPDEITHRLRGHDKVNEAVVVVRESKTGEKYLCAYIVARQEIGERELKEYLSGDLPDYMIPAYIVMLDKIPLTPNGKVDRKALPEPEVTTAESYSPARNKVEKTLLEIWIDVLGFGRDASNERMAELVGIDSNFFELGGHSLKASILTARIHRALGVKIPLTEVFRTPTVRGLAEFIKNASGDKYEFIKAAEEKEYYGISSAQERIFVASQLDENSINYNVPIGVEVEGVLHRDRLEGALNKLIRRHEILRTSFQTINQEACQRVHSAENIFFVIEYLERSGSPGDDVENFIRPFDLSRAPLMRFALIKLAEEKHILMVDMHHIITDGTSLGIFIKELLTFYSGQELPGLKLQYKDFSEWQIGIQSDVNGNNSIKRQEQYWLGRFKGGIPQLALPTDFPRSPVRSFAGNHIPFEIDKQLKGEIRKLVLETETTLYMVLLAVLNILLLKYTLQENIVVGTGVAGRRHADLENIIGMFVNMLPIRNQLRDEKSFIKFLAEVKKNAVDAFENQDYQFEDLVEKLSIPRNTGRNPIFDVELTVQNTASVGMRMDIPGIRLKPFSDLEFKQTKFDLSVEVTEEKDVIFIFFSYSTALFKRSTIEGMFKHYIEILQQVLGNREIKLRDIKLSHKLSTASVEIKEEETLFGI